ncbi:DUF1822 family protein [Oculatella sp. LEGE 06141]|uniref:DUF1822 family protein n=1 Tax=Oculatella sp. LEGE 06141 TaxID=1828648 RepID=UPI0018822ED2|nr:DUF1822 family protein [Oculatella sp. LEGE 06141]MBE9179702.1 DUF1822 family protein [Oculatella sp. LEGE 06141]
MLNAPGDDPGQNGSLTDRQKAQAEVLNSTPTVHLSQWFQGEFEAGWQAVDELLSPMAGLGLTQTESVSIQRATPIWLDLQSARQADGILVVTLSQGSDRQIAIQLQVHAIDDTTPLVEQLTLTVIDEAGATFLETAAAAGDRLLQTPRFQGRPGERFRGLVALDQDSVALDFVI